MASKGAARQGQTYIAQDGRVHRLENAHADRARQFMPFAALTGYYELVEARGRTREPFHELTEDEAAALDRRMARVGRGTMVDITYYDRDAYVRRRGMVSRIEEVERALWVVKERIPFDMIRDIRVAGDPDEDD